MTRPATRRRPRPTPLVVASRVPPGMARPVAVSIAPGAILFTVFFLAPFAVLIGSSFASWGGLDFTFTGWDNYQTMVQDPVFWKAVRNTLFYSAVSIVIQVPFGVVVGIILSQKLPGWRTFRTVIFVPFVISGAAYALVYAAFYNSRYGLLNQTLSVVGASGKDWLYDTSTARSAVAATFAFIIGFTVILVMAEIASIPRELYEAAETDGASLLQQHLRITLPLLRNVIGTCILVRLLGDIGMFDVVFILTSGGPNDSTVTLALYAYRAYLDGAWGYANAVGTTILLIGLILIVTVRRAFRIGERAL